MKKILLLIIIIFLPFVKVIAKDYVIESHGKRTLIKEHIYSKKDNLKIYKLEGTFNNISTVSQ